MSGIHTGIDGSTVLIVDDIPANLAIAVDHLEDNNFQVLVAQDGEEGIERARLVKPDLVLLDVMMPGIDGFETCRRLKADETTRDIPVIFMTALSDSSDKIAAFDAGAVDYVTKPFQVAELMARIKTHLAMRAAQKQLAIQNAAILASETRYRRLFETAKDGILLLDGKTGRVSDVNASVIAMFGYSRDHFLNHKLCEIPPFAGIPVCRSVIAELEISESVCFDHWLLQTRDRSTIDIEFTGNAYEVDGARIVQCNLRDITGRKQAEECVRHMALHDTLTGLPNRALLQDRLTLAIALARRNREHIAVLMLDLDKFKEVNDSLGHHIGDVLLVAVGARLKSCIRESDTVARLGGDEFVIVLPGISDAAVVEQIVGKLRALLVAPFQIEGHELQISGSIGISQFPVDGGDPGTLLRKADTAMYEAKAKGRSTHCLFTSELDRATQRRAMLMSDLHNASARGEFVLHYQPLVETGSGAITAVEALLRWNHPRLGPVSPVEFIPLLEESGLIIEVGNWVLNTACMQNVVWQRDGLPPVRVAVNVSAMQFYRGNIARAVKASLSESQMDAKWLELELTETLTLDGSETTINIMQDLKALGVSLSLDDFGTGWSSLSCLRRFPLDRIKIDRSFMRDISSQPAAEAVVTSIIDLAANLGFACVAEGVETAEQLAYLQEKGCPEMQGFLYSPGLPAAHCGALMLAGNPEFATQAVTTTGSHDVQ